MRQLKQGWPPPPPPSGVLYFSPFHTENLSELNNTPYHRDAKMPLLLLFQDCLLSSDFYSKYKISWVTVISTILHSLAV